MKAPDQQVMANPIFQRFLNALGVLGHSFITITTFPTREDIIFGLTVRLPDGREVKGNGSLKNITEDLSAYYLLVKGVV